MRGRIGVKSTCACPFCSSRKVWKNRGYWRTVVGLGAPRTHPVRQWRCGDCGKTWTDPLPGVEKGARYAKEVKREAVRALFEAEQNVPAVAREMRRGRGWAPSASTIRRAMQRAMRGITEPEAPSSGILEVDEKFISLSGRKVPALVVRDATTRVILAVRVLPDRSPEAIEAVLRPVAEATRAHTLVTDDHRSYPVVARRLGLRHQLCQTHLLRKLNRKLHIYLSRKRWGMTAEKRKREKDRIRALFHAFCNSKWPARYLAAIAAVGRKHRPLARFVGHFLREWPHYHTFRRVPGCPSTSNGVENGIGSLENHLRRLKGFRSGERADGFLALWVLRANFRPFESGPFSGRCPLEMAGLDVKGRNWLDFTGLAD